MIYKVHKSLEQATFQLGTMRTQVNLHIFSYIADGRQHHTNVLDFNFTGTLRAQHNKKKSQLSITNHVTQYTLKAANVLKSSDDIM